MQFVSFQLSNYSLKFPVSNNISYSSIQLNTFLKIKILSITRDKLFEGQIKFQKQIKEYFQCQNFIINYRLVFFSISSSAERIVNFPHVYGKTDLRDKFIDQQNYRKLQITTSRILHKEKSWDSEKMLVKLKKRRFLYIIYNNLVIDEWKNHCKIVGNGI